MRIQMPEGVQACQYRQKMKLIFDAITKIGIFTEKLFTILAATVIFVIRKHFRKTIFRSILQRLAFPAEMDSVQKQRWAGSLESGADL